MRVYFNHSHSATSSSPHDETLPSIFFSVFNLLPSYSLVFHWNKWKKFSRKNIYIFVRNFTSLNFLFKCECHSKKDGNIFLLAKRFNRNNNKNNSWHEFFLLNGVLTAVFIFNLMHVLKNKFYQPLQTNTTQLAK